MIHCPFGQASVYALLLSLPGRLSEMGRSLWLDEAWVANSLLTPSLAETFYFERWTQSSPPLFLAIAWASAHLFGASEAALRIVPLLASLCGLCIMAVVLHRLLPAPSALLGLTLAASNYWIIKYGQQVKQYGTDILTASVMLLVVERTLRQGSNRTGYWLLALTGAVSAFASFPAMFWFPSLVAAAALAGPERRPASLRAALLAVWLGVCLAILYAVFVQPNLNPKQFRNFAVDFFDPARPLSSALALQRNFGTLLIPLNTALVAPFTWLATATMLLGALRAFRSSLRGDRIALAVSIAGPLPIASAILTSAAHLYPLFTYPRFLLWAAPCCALLTGYALAPVFRRWQARPSGTVIRVALPVACIAVVLASQFVLFAFPRPFEQNREAAQFIRAHAHGADVIYVHGGMREQFHYYRGLLSWSSGEIHAGTTGWPCCALDPERRVSKEVTTLEADVALAAAKARNRILWLLLPAAETGHWSRWLAPRIAELPAVLETKSCRQQRRQPFGQTLVLAFACD